MISLELKDICEDMLKNPQDWKQTRYTFDNDKKHIYFWTATGTIGLNPWQSVTVPSLNIFEKFYLRKHINKSVMLKFKQSL